MSNIQLSTLIAYLRRHPGYCCKFVGDLFRVWWHILLGHKIVVVTTESEGLGGYLWIRSYYKLIRDHYSPNKCCIILLGMAGWKEFINQVDKPEINVFRPFESCDSPKRIESAFFKFFTADVYLNFRAIHIPNLVKARKCILGKGHKAMELFYEDGNDHTLCEWISIPDGFKHTLPLVPIEKSRLEKIEQQPYIVLVEGGFTQGGMSELQIKAIADYCIEKGFNIFYNGKYDRIKSILPQKLHHCLIDGYSYPLKEYASVIKGAKLVVTPNTLIYHYAIQLEKPCVVMSANDWLTIKFDKKDQTVLFNKELQDCYENNKLKEYQPIENATIAGIETERIIDSIQKWI